MNCDAVTQPDSDAREAKEEALQLMYGHSDQEWADGLPTSRLGWLLLVLRSIVMKGDSK